MDVHHQPNAAAAASSLGDLFPHEPSMESEDSSTEWLSIFVEDCLSTSASYPVSAQQAPTTMTSQGAAKPKLPLPSSSNMRRKKRSLASVTRERSLASVMREEDDEHCLTLFVEPPLLLLDQKHWLAESELILPKKDKDQELVQQQEQEHEEEDECKASAGMQFQQKQLVMRCNRCLSNETPRWRDGPLGLLCNACNLKLKARNGFVSLKRSSQESDEEQEKWQEKRKKVKKAVYVHDDELPPELPVRRCSHCMSYRTPQWRTGPLGPKTLCNACGVRFKSGRLLPEYRPANSPTFVSEVHSNSHKKVMQLRKEGK